MDEHSAPDAALKHLEASSSLNATLVDRWPERCSSSAVLTWRDANSRVVGALIARFAVVHGIAQRRFAVASTVPFTSFDAGQPIFTALSAMIDNCAALAALVHSFMPQLKGLEAAAVIQVYTRAQPPLRAA